LPPAGALPYNERPWGGKRVASGLHRERARSGAESGGPGSITRLPVELVSIDEAIDRLRVTNPFEAELLSYVVDARARR
jgi:hypothetical protein